jgi:hypothetical protein
VAVTIWQKDKVMAKAKRKIDRADTEPLVNEFAAAHGDYREHAEYGEARNAKVNRGGSAIERWLNETDSLLFTDQSKAAIRYCRALWQMIDKKGPPDLSGIRTALWEGQSEHQALGELAVMKRRFPVAYWSCFENICRFEMDAPTSGRNLANNNRSASDAAKQCTAFVAGMIATWEGF